MILPSVFIVNDTYHIMVYTSHPTLVWAEIGGTYYYDDSNGILRSDTFIHRIVVPQNCLDSVKSYTIYKRPIIERKAYFTETAELIKESYDFHPVEGDVIRAYHISDAHNRIEEPIEAAGAFGNIDFLILNGDIPDSSQNIENIINIYKITSALTHGNVPVVFARGNHDMRGVCAERFAEYTPTDCGRTYYTFHLGSIWGMVLDCGEDKIDSDIEYGNTICCHSFREKETQFIRNVIENADREYASGEIDHRLIVVHMPFTRSTVYEVAEEIYAEWDMLLKEHICPDVMIAGHEHTVEIDRPGCEHDDCCGQPCPVVIGGTTNYKDYFAGAGYEFDKTGITVTFTDSNKKVLGKERL